MSIDKLQEMIRKKKNPSVLTFCLEEGWIPPYLLQERKLCQAYEEFAMALLEGLRQILPAVRFDFGSFSLQGVEGLELLSRLTGQAGKLGYYVLLDTPQILSPISAAAAAKTLISQECQWHFDGLICSPYIGSDALRPFASKLNGSGKALVAVLRTANKSAAEMQDLLTGGRLVHLAMADIVNSMALPLVGRSGYSQLAAMAGASSADSLRSLRAKYKHLFLLLDGYDYPNANAKNCAQAFDKLGHGAAACAGSSIAAAWLEGEGGDYVACAQQAAERMKKNLTRYVTVL